MELIVFLALVVIALLIYGAVIYLKKEQATPISPINDTPLQTRFKKVEDLSSANLETIVKSNAEIRELKEKVKELFEKIEKRDLQVIQLQNNFTEALINLKRPLAVTISPELLKKTRATPKGKGVKSLIENAGI